MDQLVQHQQTINDQLARYGVKFGLYKNGTFQERLFPFDPLPRVITAQEFETLDEGLVQRVDALNLFLKDVYGEKKIIRDGIVPEDFVFAGSGYLPQCEGFVPPKGVYSHISGIDLVQAKDGSWFILEDNLRIPSGASYPLIARELCRRCSPETFSGNASSDTPLQFTFVWGMKNLFGVDGLTFSGFADIWGENTKFWYADPVDKQAEEGKFIFISEPQLWYNVGKHFGVDNLNIGTEIELSYNFAGNHGFYCRPCLGTKWVF